MNEKEDDATQQTRRRQRSPQRRAWSLMSFGLLVAAVVTELRKPTADRTWVGRLAGFIPYDLRRPTVARARQRWWNAADPRVIVPKVFGVGWTVNLRSLWSRVHTVVAGS